MRFDGDGLCAKMIKGRALMASQLVHFSMGRRERSEAFLVSFKAK